MILRKRWYNKRIPTNTLGIEKKECSAIRKEFQPNPWFYPLPVLIIGIYDENSKSDAMNATWGGLYDNYHVLGERVGNAFSDGLNLK